MDKLLESRRKIVHMLVGIILVLLITYDWANPLILGIGALLAILFFYSSTKIQIPAASWLLDRLERPEAREKLPGRGVIFYLIGALASLIFFTKDVAIASILILAIGDSAPNLVGLCYDCRIKRPFSEKKYIEGAFVGLVLSFIAASFFVRWHEALIGSFVAIFLEGIDMKIGLRKIDDNLIVPISAGLTISLLRWIF
jgi:dolichol kinase